MYQAHHTQMINSYPSTTFKNRNPKYPKSKRMNQITNVVLSLLSTA